MTENTENKSILEKSQEILDKARANAIIRNKYIEFEYEDKTYRVKKPSLKESEMVQTAVAERYNEMLNKVDSKGNSLFKTEEQLILEHKKRGLDIKALDEKLDALSEEYKNKQLSIASQINSMTPEDVEKAEKELQIPYDKLRKHAEHVTLIRMNKLGTSIEYTLQFYSYRLLAFYITEVKVDEDRWEPAFTNYDEYENISTEFYEIILANIMNLVGRFFNLV